MSQKLVFSKAGESGFQAHQRRLLQLQHRASHICGVTPDGKPLGATIAAILAEAHKSNTDEAALKEREQYLLKAENDPAVQAELCTIRVATASNYALADANLASFFCEVVQLKDDERFIFQNNTVQQTLVRTTGGDSGPKNFVKIVPSQTEELIPLKWLSTDEVRVKIVDIYRGRIADAQESIVDMGNDWNMKIEDEVESLVMATTANGGLFGDFELGSKTRKEMEVFVPNRRIKLANLPTSNDLVTPGNTTTTGFRFAVISQALDYEARWGNALRKSLGTPQLTGRILIPGGDVTNIAKEVVPTGNTNNKVADQLLENGWSTVSYLGRTFTLVQDNTLDLGTCLFEFVRKPGQIFQKPGLAREERRDDYETRKTNEEYRYMKAPFGAYINHTHRIHALRIKYRK